jgi:hypothetical protein
MRAYSDALTRAQHTALIYTQRAHSDAAYILMRNTPRLFIHNKTQHVIHAQHAVYTTRIHNSLTQHANLCAIHHNKPRLLHTLTCAHHAALTCDTLTCAHHAALTRITLRITPCLLASRCASRRAYSYHAAHHTTLTRITLRIMPRITPRLLVRNTMHCSYLYMAYCVYSYTAYYIYIYTQP